MITRRVHRNTSHVWSQDPALDTSNGFAEKWEGFLKSGDTSALPVKSGQRPTVFKLASLKREAMLQLSDVVHADLRALARGGADGVVGLAFLRTFEAVVARGLVDAQDFVDDAGRPIGLRFEDDGRGGKVLAKETLEDLLYPDLVRELGLRILEISTPGPTQGQG